MTRLCAWTPEVRPCAPDEASPKVPRRSPGTAPLPASRRREPATTGSSGAMTVGRAGRPRDSTCPTSQRSTPARPRPTSCGWVRSRVPSAAKGYPLVVTMADSFSIERRRLMRFLGAKVVLTPRAAKGYGMYVKTKELAEASDWFLARQFETDANAKIHENTTARELLADCAGAPRRLGGRVGRARPTREDHSEGQGRGPGVGCDPGGMGGVGSGRRGWLRRTGVPLVRAPRRAPPGWPAPPASPRRS